jgi:hypothetical protein
MCIGKKEIEWRRVKSITVCLWSDLKVERKKKKRVRERE